MKKIWEEKRAWEIRAFNFENVDLLHHMDNWFYSFKYNQVSLTDSLGMYSSKIGNWTSRTENGKVKVSVYGVNFMNREDTLMNGDWELIYLHNYTFKLSKPSLDSIRGPNYMAWWEK